MLENQADVSSESKLSLIKSPAGPAPTLKEMVAQDRELLEFFRLVHEHDLREKALEMVESRMARSKD